MEKLLHLPFDFDQQAFAQHLHLDEDDLEDFQPCLEEALRIANPKAAFTRSSVRVEEGNVVYIGDTRFESALLAKNLQGRAFVYPFVITCGMELYELYQQQEDPIMRYWLEMTAENVLRCVTGGVFETIQAKYNTGAKYTMNPGSLPEWPIANQAPLFGLHGDIETEIGVKLTASMLMVPAKTISGLLFESEENYVNCAFCTRTNCPSRRAPYHG